MLNILKLFDIKEALIRMLVVFSVAFFLDIFIYPFTMRIYAKFSFLLENHIRSITVITEPADVNNMYIYTASRIQIYKDIDKSTKIIPESMMQKKSHNGLENFILQKNEIAFSRNVMEDNGLKIGNDIYLELFNVMEKYTIKSVLPANYGMIDDPMLNCGIAILGYDPAFETRLKVKYVLFSEADFDLLPNNIRIKTDYTRGYRDFFLLFLLWLAVLYLLYLAVLKATHVLLNNLLKEDYSYHVRRLYSLGLSSKLTFFMALSIPVVLIFFPMTLGLIMCITVFSKNIPHTYSIISFIVLSMLASSAWTFSIVRSYYLSGKLWKKY
jgi:hypothetical protein